MITSAKNKLFEEKLRLYGREYFLSVSVMLNPDKTNYYRCIVDEIKILDLWIDDHGNWVDMQNGHSELSDAIGKRIEEKVLPLSVINM